MRNIPIVQQYSIHNAIDLAPPWTTPTFSTDYFHVCGDYATGVPENTGFEYPHSGDAYAGYNFFGGPTSAPPNGAEYLEVPLISALEKDSFYLLELFVSLNDDFVQATDEFSILFTDTFFYDPTQTSTPSLIIYADPQLTNEPGNFITNQDGWTPLRWVYQARGGEAYMTMGVFRSPFEINWIQIAPWGGVATYYYIDDVSLEKLPYPLATLGLQDTILCALPFEVTPAASGLHNGYLWNTGDTTQSITVTEPGIYILEAYYQEFLIRDTAVVQYLPPENFDLGPDLHFCPQELPYAFSAPAGLDIYRWNTGDSTAQVQIDAPGWYILEVDYACGTAIDSIFVEVEDWEVLDLGPDTLFCGPIPTDFQLQAPTSYTTYAWNTGATTAQIPVQQPGWYGLTAEHLCSTQSDSILIRQQDILSLQLPTDTMLCEVADLVLTAGPGFDQYIWSTGSTAATIAPVTFGTYSVTATYACGTESQTISIIQAPELLLSLPNQLEVSLGDVVTLQPTVSGGQGLIYQWQPAEGLSCTDCPNPQLLAGGAADVYTLTVLDQFGCEAQAEVRLLIRSHERIFVPNAFSPNGDGINDYLNVFTGPEVKSGLHLQIYDRWGGMVFQSDDLPANHFGKGWDGTARGKPLSSGIYVWQLEAELINGKKIAKSGEVMLVR
ncbi:MAG: hypothetical protein DHS20C18_11270 [Saprospiraceae bacterium]|nr:MAG: hypothetical protein DHS20C18_11270 [Saprospiraceae bacterium]